jgi:peptidylprolyl isomerase
MRRTLPALLLILAACGGGDDDSVGGTSATVADTSPTGSADGAPVQAEGCESAPEPAGDDVGIPQAVRPCEIPTELVTHLMRAGSGRVAETGDTMIVDYVGIRAEDGAIFDDSYSRGVPIQFPLGRGGVIPGWDDGLTGTQAGSMVKLDIPGDLAYGEQPPGGDDGVIQPGDALSFVVEVRAVVPPVTAADAPLDLEIESSIGATDVTVTELVAGDGEIVELGDVVVAHLLLVRGDNKVVLFNTWEQSDPSQITLVEGQTLPGLLQALPGKQVGSMLKVAMPPADAFGEDGDGRSGLPAGVDLIAIVDIVGVY